LHVLNVLLLFNLQAETAAAMAIEGQQLLLQDKQQLQQQLAGAQAQLSSMQQQLSAAQEQNTQLANMCEQVRCEKLAVAFFLSGWSWCDTGVDAVFPDLVVIIAVCLERTALAALACVGCTCDCAVITCASRCVGEILL
jgi:Tfp pilus assembly protein FimV